MVHSVSYYYASIDSFTDIVLRSVCLCFIVPLLCQYFHFTLPLVNWLFYLMYFSYSISFHIMLIWLCSLLLLVPGLRSRSRRESEVFGWSRSRNPKSTRSQSRSRNF